MAPVVTMRQLLESGVHFGHQTRRWNPKMKRYIFTERNGIYIIDLQQSLDYIDNAFDFVKETVAHGGTILYVGTKKQAQEAIAEQARRVGMPYVNQRWLGGMLTNFGTVYTRLQRLKELEEIDFDDPAKLSMTKKEMLHLRREKDKLERSLGGIRDMSRVPSAVWIVDTKKEHIAVSEARKLGIPVIAILDTNCDPDEVTYPIPGNDDAIRSVSLLTRVLSDAVADGLLARAGAAVTDEKPAEGMLGAEEPLAEWELELLEGSRSDAPDSVSPDSNETSSPDQLTAAADSGPEPGELAARLAVVTQREADMANYTAADVKRLRELTGAGMLDCKNALVAAAGDFDRAVEALRIKGAKDVGKRAQRTAANGLVIARLAGTSAGVLVELNCETDFVAKTELFQRLAADVADAALAAGADDPPDVLGLEARDGRTVQALVDEASASIGEKLELGRYARLAGGYVGSYLHKSDPGLPPTLGVLVQLDEAGASVSQEMAHQIAAMRPRYVTRDEVPADVLAAERRIAEQMTRDEGKPERVIPKIVEGRLNAFLADVVLAEQQSIRDSKTTVAQLLAEAGATVRRFARFQVGQAS